MTTVGGLLPAAAASAAYTGTEGLGPKAVHYGEGCDATLLPRDDDNSSGVVPLVSDEAFPDGLRFFGQTYPSLYVNNNGNVTFDGPLSTYDPYPLADPQSDVPAMIAPFFADVETTNPASAQVTYGMTTFAGRPAFCAMWAGVGVGYYDDRADKLNSFQLLLVDRSEVGAGDFDIVFNYDQVQWEAGDASDGTDGLGGDETARVGFTNGASGEGTTRVALELPGSGVAGGLLDGNPSTGLIHNSAGLGLGEPQLGRYVFPVRNGAPPEPGSIVGDVLTGSPATAVSGALVSACRTGTDTTTTATCQTTATNASGRYQLPGLAAGDWTVRVSPASPLVAEQQSVVVENGPEVVDFLLEGPATPPSGTTVGDRTNDAGVPVVVVGAPFDVRVSCPGGSGTVEFLQDGAPLTVTHGGVPTTSVPLSADGDDLVAEDVVLGVVGNAQVRLTLTGCPTPSSAFDLYIDPSGKVLDQAGGPIAGAQVTLHRSDTADGPFTQVPDGSLIMSDANRQNPMASRADGYYGWMTVPGFYVVRATAPADSGCTVPGPSLETVVSSAVLPVPPEQTGIDLVFECPVTNTAPEVQAPADVTVDATGPAGAQVAFPAPVVVDAEQDDLAATCWPASGTTFAIGATAVTCTATDDGGLSDAAGFTVTVRGAADQLAALRATVVGYRLAPRGQERALTSKIDAAATAVARDRSADACGPLKAVLNHTAAQRGKALSSARAAEVTAATTRIRAVLGC